MNEERLDEVLRTGAEPEPADGGFTERVMAAVRRDVVKRAPFKRWLTRPALIAAAAVLVAGGALAAVRTVVAPEPARTAAAPSAQPAGLLPEQTPAQPGPTLTAPPRPTGRPGETPPPFKRGTAEYGYTSEHTAYAVDRGLRLEAETHTNSAAVGEPHRITLTLENITDHPIGIYAPQGCALTVAAYHREEPRTKDSTGAKVWNCAGDGGDPRTMQKQEPQMFVLEPHARRVETALVGYTEPGEWYIVSQCICYDRQMRTPPPSPAPTKSPSSILDIAVGGNETPPPGRDQPPTAGGPYGSRSLFTPPIRINAE